MGHRQVSTLKRKLIESGQCADAKAITLYLREKCSVPFSGRLSLIESGQNSCRLPPTKVNSELQAK